MVRRPSFSAVLCFYGFTREGGAFSIFLAERAVLLQNLSQSLPLLQMKLVIFAKGLEPDHVLEWHFDVRIEGMVDSGCW